MKLRLSSLLMQINASMLLMLFVIKSYGFQITDSSSFGPEFRLGIGHPVFNHFRVFGPKERAKYTLKSFARPYGVLEYQNKLCGKFNYSIFFSYQKYAFEGSPFRAEWFNNQIYFETYQRFYFYDYRFGIGIGHDILNYKKFNLNLFVNYSTHLQGFYFPGFVEPIWNIKIENYYTAEQLERAEMQNIRLPELGFNNKEQRNFESHLNLSFIAEMNYKIGKRFYLFHRTILGFTKYAQHDGIGYSGSVFEGRSSQLVLEFDRQYYWTNCLGFIFKLDKKTNRNLSD